MPHKPRQIPLFADTPNGDAAVPYTFAIMREAAIAMARRSENELRKAVPDRTWWHPASGDLSAAAAETLIHFRMIALEVPPVPPPAAGLFWFAKQMSFTADPLGIEMVRDPVYKSPAWWIGDCDDRAVLMAAVLELFGFAYRFVAVSRSGKRLEHVFIAPIFEYQGKPRAVLLDPQEEKGPDTVSRVYARWLIERYPHQEARS